MSPKARFVSYINLFILLLFVFLTIYGTFLITSVIGGASALLFIMLLILVFIIWGVVNVFKHFKRKTLSSWEWVLLSIPVINLVLLISGIVVLSTIE
jgi:hypothetical protein